MKQASNKHRPMPSGPAGKVAKAVARMAGVAWLGQLLGGTCPAAVVNPGFDSGAGGLDGWQVLGSVYSTGQQGVLSDDAAPRSMLWQDLAAGLGPHVLQFDLLAVLAGVGGAGTLPDSFFVSVYSLPSAAAFDPVNGVGFTAALAVLDMDASGLTNAAPGLQVGPSPKGGSYLRVAVEFVPADARIAPVFDLANLNFVAADSVVAIDNVTITAVPECGPITLAALGLSGLAARRRR